MKIFSFLKAILVISGFCFLTAIPVFADSEYPMTRLGIEGFVGNGSLTLQVADSPDWAIQEKASAVFTNNAPSPSSGRLLVKLLPELNYYLRANRPATSNNTSQEHRTVNIAFDVPSGYQLLVDSRPQDTIQEEVFDDGKKTWSLRLTKNGRGGIQTGAHLTPYLGEDHILDLYLGYHEGGDNGWIRLKQPTWNAAGQITSAVNRSMVMVRREFLDVTVAETTAGYPSGISAPGVDVTLTDIPNGFQIQFQATASTAATTYTVTKAPGVGGALERLKIEKTGGRQRGYISWEAIGDESDLDGGKTFLIAEGDTFAGQETEWRRRQIKRWKPVLQQLHFDGFWWTKKEEETSMSRHARDTNGRPIGDLVTGQSVDSWRRCYFSVIDFTYVASGALSPPNLGGDLVDEILVRKEVASDDNLTTPTLRKTDYSYYDSFTDGLGSIGKLKSRKEATGDWTYIVYSEEPDSRGVIQKVYTPVNDYALPSYTGMPNPVLCLETVSTYGSWATNEPFKRASTGAITRRLGQEISRSQRALSTEGNLRVASTTVYSNSTESLTSTESFYSPLADVRLIGKPVSVSAGGDVQVVYDYNFVTVTPTVGGEPEDFLDVRKMTKYRSGNSFIFVPGKSTSEESRENVGNSRIIESASYILKDVNGSTKDAISKTSYTYNDEGQLIESLDVFSQIKTTNAWGDGRLASSTDASGVVTTYTYDPFGRVIKTTTSGVSNHTISDAGLSHTFSEAERSVEAVLDGLGRPLVTTASAAGTSEVLTQQRSYFPNGLLKSTQAACCNKSSYEYLLGAEITAALGGVSDTTAVSGILVTTPTGAKELKTFRMDGSPYQIWQTDPTSPSGALTLISTTAVSVDASNRIVSEQRAGDINAPAWSRNILDWMGRSVAAESSAFPDINGSSRSVNTSFAYHTATGRLIASESNTGRAPVLTEYNDIEGSVRSALDLNSNGQIETNTGGANSDADRVSDELTRFVFLNGQWWAESQSSVWLPDNTNRTTATKRSRFVTNNPANATIRTLSEEIAIDEITGRTVTSVTTYDSTEKKITTTTTDSLTQISTKTISSFGKSRAASLPAPATGWVTSSYDILGRHVATTHPLSGTTRTGYKYGSTKAEWSLLEGKTKTTIDYFMCTDAIGSRSQPRDSKTWIFSGGNPSDPASYSTLQSTVTYAYNAAGLPVTVSGSGTTYTEFSYDKFGRRISQVTKNASAPDNAGQVKTTWIYDPASGLLKEKRHYSADSTYQSQTFTYDLAGALLSSTDPRGKTTSFTYSAAGEATSVEYDAAFSGPEISTTYDRLGRPKTTTDETLGLRTFAYRASDFQLESVTFESGYYGDVAKSIHYGYHEAVGDHRPASISVRNASGQEIYRSAYSYTALGFLDTVTSANSSVSGANRTFDYDYDSAQNPYAPTSLVTQVSPGAIYRHDYHYDALGRLDAIASGTRSSTTASLFSSTSTGHAIANGADSALSAHYFYTRNALGQIIGEERRGKLFSGFSGSDGYSGLATSYAYDDKGRLIDAHSRRLNPGVYGDSTAYQATNPLPGFSETFEYDASGNRIRRALTIGTANQLSQSFLSVNRLNQLTQAITPGILSVAGTADPAAQIAVAGIGETAPGSTERIGGFFHRAIPFDNALAPLDVTAHIVAQMPAASGQTARPTTYASRTGSLAQATDNAFSYDASGNLLTTASFVFAYDALGRLSSAIRTASTPGGYRQPIDTQRYRYGADSQRLEKRHNGSATRYLYHGMDVIAEVSVALSANTTLPGTSSAAVNSAQLKKTYHWRPTGIGRAGRLLQITDHSANRAALAGYDGRGNLTTWTDAATGALLGGRDYSAYGTAQLEIWYDTDAKELFGKTGFSYSTEYLDETGLIYFGFRYYSPEHGRFISRDPLGEAASGANLYAFANNDPVNYRELYGLCPTEGGGTGGRSPEDEVEELEPFIVKPPTYGDWEEFYSEWIDESTYCTTYERTVTEYDSTGEIEAEYFQYRTVCEYYRGTNEEMDDWYGDEDTGQEPPPEEKPKRSRDKCFVVTDLDGQAFVTPDLPGNSGMKNLPLFAPPGLDLEKNLESITRQPSAESMNVYGVGMYDNADAQYLSAAISNSATFVLNIKTAGPWDYKNPKTGGDPVYMAFGNWHFGYIATGMGIPNLMQNLGAALFGSDDPKHVGPNSKGDSVFDHEMILQGRAAFENQDFKIRPCNDREFVLFQNAPQEIDSTQ